jgi:hypothetical protein
MAQVMEFMEELRQRPALELPALAAEDDVAWCYPPLPYVQQARRRRQEQVQQKRFRKASSAFPLARTWHLLQRRREPGPGEVREDEDSQRAGGGGADAGGRDRVAAPEGGAGQLGDDEDLEAMMLGLGSARRGPGAFGR